MTRWMQARDELERLKALNQLGSAALVEFLATHDMACPGCGYNLRGLAAPRCPECGRYLRLSIEVVDPTTAIWLIMLVALLPATPFGMISGFIFSRPNFSTSDLRTATQMWFYALGIYTLLAIPASVVVLAVRQWFIAMPRAVQMALAIVPVTFDLGALITVLFVAANFH